MPSSLKLTLGTGVETGILSRPVFATVSAATTLTLVVTSASTIKWPSAYGANHIILPDTATLVVGWLVTIINNADVGGPAVGVITIETYQGALEVLRLGNGQSVTLICNSIASNGVAAWDVVGQSQPLWLVATNDAVTAANATETDLSWTDRIGNMADALSSWLGGPINNIFKAPATGEYTFRMLLEYESTGTATNPNTGLLSVKLTQSDNTLIKQICATGVPYADLGGGLYIDGTNTLEWTLSLTAGDTVKHRVYFQDGGDGNSLNFYAATCQLKITQEL